MKITQDSVGNIILSDAGHRVILSAEAVCEIVRLAGEPGVQRGAAGEMRVVQVEHVDELEVCDG